LLYDLVCTEPRYEAGEGAADDPALAAALA
jgi:hypothetical protein